MILYIRLLELFLGYIQLYSDTLNQLYKHSINDKKNSVECYAINLMGRGIILPIVWDFSIFISLFGSHNLS